MATNNEWPSKVSFSLRLLITSPDRWHPSITYCAWLRSTSIESPCLCLHLGTAGGLQVYDSVSKRHHQHVPFAPIISADTPARAKYGGFLAPSAFVACFHCFMEGHKFEDNKEGTYFSGYHWQQPQELTGDGELVYAWDARQKEDKDHRANCALVEGAVIY